MSDRTTVNIDKQTHTAANHIKTDFGESWPEVLDFYTQYRPIVSEIENGQLSNDGLDVDEIVDELRNELSMASDPTVSPDVDGMMERIDELTREVRKCQEIAEQARDNTDTITEGMR